MLQSLTQNCRLVLQEAEKAAKIAQKKAMEFKDNGFEYRENILAHINQIKERLMFEAQGRGINKEHMQKFMDEKCSPDFELANVVQRMIDEKIVSPENGYPNP